MITGMEQVGRRWGGDPSKPHDEGFFIWDIKDPVNPKKLGQWKTGGRGTHRIGYPGGRYVYVAAALPGYQDELLVIVDIQDPANPKEVARWSAPGQHVAAGEKPEDGMQLHGPAIVDGNRAYLDYGAAGMHILDISDIRKPRSIGSLDFTGPFDGGIPVHSILPMKSRNLVWVNSEAIAEDCKEGLGHASLVDITDETRPRLLSIMPVPVPPAGAPYADFCGKGARFGPHNINHLQHHPDVEKQGTLMYLTYFNAGLRVFDISNARVAEGSWLLHPARSGEAIRSGAHEAGRADRGRAGRSARLRLRDQQEPGALDPALHRAAADGDELIRRVRAGDTERRRAVSGKRLEV